MLTLFTWGYWGWGNATSEFVRAADTMERERGFKPLIFVDIRFRRTVRAKGFSGSAFEKLLAKPRYYWLQRLGNQSIGTGEKKIRIVDPSAAKELLRLAVDARTGGRRLLFFCACEYPRWCHRNTVTNLVLRQAMKEGRHVRIVEWPGGPPIQETVEVAAPVLRAMLRGRKSVPLGKATKLGRLTCLPWGSIVVLESDREKLPIVTGPAKFRKVWSLTVLECGDLGADVGSLLPSSEGFRKKYGMLPHQV
jgi:hypothetical protein